MKKYKVELPKKNILGRLAHQFLEVRIADEIYSVIKNSLKSEHQIENSFNDIDLISYKTNLLNNNPFLRQIDSNLDNENYLAQYDFYRDIALKMTHLRSDKIGFFDIYGKLFTGLAYIRPNLNDLKSDIKNLILINEKIRQSKIEDIKREINSNDKFKNIKAKYENIEKYSTLKGEPRSILLIEYVLIITNKIGDYLIDKKSSQSERGAKFKELYNNTYESVIKTKNDHFKTKNDFENLSNNKEVLEKAILFVYQNLEKEKENINKEFLEYLLEQYNPE
ncbi:MAG: hypothetical protein ACRC8Z_15195 [Empedobacter falsenii]